jgi:hypothetical protein
MRETSNIKKPKPPKRIFPERKKYVETANIKNLRIHETAEFNESVKRLATP